jgi:hypothetical protein
MFFFAKTQKALCIVRKKKCLNPISLTITLVHVLTITLLTPTSACNIMVFSSLQLLALP